MRVSRVSVVLAVLATGPFGLAAAAAAEQRHPIERVTWWNDPAIAQEIGISEAQRQKMDEAYAGYQKATEPALRQRAAQTPYLEALEKGDWEQARKEAERWLEAEQTPRRAMVDLKLTILPMLTPEQRTLLLERYPRLLRRGWGAAPRWRHMRERERPTPANPKPAEGAPADKPEI